MSIKVEKISEPAVLGEGPHWDEQHQCLYYVSIFEKLIHKYVPATGARTKTTLDGFVGFIVPVEGTTDQFVVGVGRKFQVVQWDGAEDSKVTVLKELGEVDPASPNNRINDGKADPRGRLVAGTMGLENAPGKFEPRVGNLFRIDSSKESVIENIATHITVSNGLAWDLKEKAFYYIDSPERKIRRYDYDVETGEISNLTYIFDFDKYDLAGFPDGMTIDTDGILWVAVFGGSSVLKINPKTGELLSKVPIPSLQVTSVTFGGPDYDILFVTSANLNLTGEQPLTSGCTFKITGLGARGLPNVNVNCEVLKHVSMFNKLVTLVILSG